MLLGSERHLEHNIPPDSVSVSQSEADDEHEKNIPKYTCEICKKDFAGPMTLKIHQRVHSNSVSPQKLSNETTVESQIETHSTKNNEILVKSVNKENQDCLQGNA